MMTPTSTHLFGSLNENSILSNLSQSIDVLMLASKQVKSIEGVNVLLPNLLEALPHFVGQQFRTWQENCLTNLLKHASAEQQQKLAIGMGQWHLKEFENHNLLSAYVEAMHFFGKATQIAKQHNFPSKQVHRLASIPMMHLVNQYLVDKDTFAKCLDDARRSRRDDHKAFMAFTGYINQIGYIRRFCCQSEDFQIIQTLYERAAHVLNLIPNELEEKYRSCNEKILLGLGRPFAEPKQYVTEKYWEDLQVYRCKFSSIDERDTRAYQRKITKAFKEFFAVLLEDGFAIIGPPPCEYDIRAMGSLGREEPCPFSDLEFFILIEDVKYKTYFQSLVGILEVQVACLGETSTVNPVFTCIHTKNPSGFHIDSSPSLNPSLIGTPEEMAKLQNNPIDDPQTIETTMLRSISLSQSRPALFFAYEKALEVPLEACRKKRAQRFFKLSCEDYKKCWKQPFNPQSDIVHLKEQFVAPLNYFLSHMAFGLGIRQTNTLDIVDALVKKRVFTKNSASLLKESAAAIYAVRIRLHTAYKEQIEETKCPKVTAPFQSLSPGEVSALEKCYWLVLFPIYSCLEKQEKKTFQNIDLLQQGFTNALSSQNLKVSLVRFVAEHLCQSKVDDQKHEEYFGALSKLNDQEGLCNIYLQVLKKYQAISAIEKLLYIPNSSGLRLIFNRNYQKLYEGLEVITNSFSTQGSGKIKVRVTVTKFKTPRYLKPSIIAELFEGNKIKRYYNNSAHRVCPITYQGHKLHFKQKPGHPLMEYAIHNLSSRLQGDLTPTVELVRFDVDVNGKTVCRPVLISQTISGKTLRQALPKKAQFDQIQYTWHLLVSILTRPGDGRLSNYVLDNHGKIYCVDNDVSFVEPVVKSWMSRTVQFCSALFTVLPLNTPLDSKTLEKFASLDGSAILNGWIEDVIAKEQEYTALFTKKERERLYKEDPNNAFTTTVLFREGTLATLNLQFWQLQNTIQKLLSENQPVTSGDLLKELISLREEAIGIYVYKTYLKAETQPIGKRLQQTTSRTQEQSLTSALYHEACLGKIPTIEEIEFHRRFCPQNARRELFLSLLQRVGQQGQIKVGKGQTTIQANFIDLKNAAAREALTLKALLIQSQLLKPETLILNHSRLKSSDLEPFLHQDLKHLDLRYCTQLGNSTPRNIQAKCPKLKILYLNGCSNITDISGPFYRPLLEFPALQQLEVSRCINLKTLQIHALNLETVSAKHNPVLEAVKLKLYPHVNLTNSPKAKLSSVPIEVQKTLKGNGESYWSLVQLKDGTLVSVSAFNTTYKSGKLLVGAGGTVDCTFKLWDVNTGQCIRTLKKQDDMICILAELKDGTLGSGSGDGTIKLWDVKTGQCTKTLQGHEKWVGPLIVLKDGTLASGSFDGIIKLWNVKTGQCNKTLKAHASSVNALMQLKDGTLVSSSAGSNIEFWDLETGKCTKTLDWRSSSVSALVQLKDGTLVGSTCSNIRLWDVKTGQCIRTLRGHEDWVYALTVLKDGTLASGSRDGIIKLWDVKTGQCIRSLRGHEDWVNALTVLKDGTLASSSRDGTIKLWK